MNNLVSGVTASQALIDRAIAERADALLVHHGYFWKGENPCVVGMKYRRLRALIENGISLIAYHLPLDAHPQLGNNAQLGLRFDLNNICVADEGGGKDLLFYSAMDRPLSPTQLADRIHTALDRPALHIAAERNEIVRVGWCSGGAQDFIEYAKDLNLDAFISGEVSEQTTHFARENNIHYFAAGHHATERYGVSALGEHIQNEFSLIHVNVDIDNPV